MAKLLEKVAVLLKEDEFDSLRIEVVSTIGREDGAYPELHSGAGKEWLVPERRPW